jgi:hypothetical protein
MRYFLIISLLGFGFNNFAQTLGANGQTFYIQPAAFIGDTPPTQMLATNAAKPASDLGLSSKVMSASQVNFTWKAPTDNTPQVYVVQRSTDAKTFTNVGQIWANRQNANQLQFTDNTLEEGTKTAQYRVIAYMQDARMQVYAPVSVTLKREE